MASFAIKNNGSSVTVLGKTYAKGDYVPIPYIKNDLNVGREKLWGNDTGRVQSGDYKGTLIGIFPKITVNVSGTKLTYKDVEAICQLCEQATASCKYYNAKTSSVKAKVFYFDSVSITHKRIDEKNPEKNKYDTISIVAVATSKE